MPATSVATAPMDKPQPPTKTERKYQCKYCSRAFSRSEHRSRHERSHTKERPFACGRCTSTFVRRDLLLRHDRTVHAKDLKNGGTPLPSDSKRRAAAKPRQAVPAKTPAAIDGTTSLDQLETGDDPFGDDHAAMLIADLQHKTTAMHEEDIGPYGGDASSVFDPSTTNLLEPTVTYPNGSIGLSAPWDAYINQPDDTKSHSISSASAAFETSHNFANGSGVQNNDFNYPSMGAHNVNGLVPALQSMIDSLPASATGTPTPLSPVLSQRPRSPVETPQIVAGFKLPQIASEEERTSIIDHIRDVAGDNSLPEGFRLPARSSLNRYLATYFGMFHHHLPFLHPSTLEPTKVSPPLLLAILSIGALYAFDQEQAYMLHIGSKVCVNQFLQNKENFSSRKCPLWTMQSSLLNMIFASWSGDAKGLEWACSIKSLLANMVAGNRYELKLRQAAREGRLPTRAEWVEDEGCRRTYFAVYIFFGLLTLTYNHTPVISYNEFEDLLLPSTEALWNLKVVDEAGWHEHLKESTGVIFMAAYDQLFQGETIKYSAFATRVMINALFLEVWYHKRSPEALQDVVTEYKLRLALESWEKSLELCEPESVAVPLSAPHEGHPLIFNAKALYRNARVRLEVDLKTVQEALRYHDSYEVAAAMSNSRDRVKRSSEMNRIIQECYDCIETAVLQGVRWVARTSPTNWSIEHPLCGLDLMITLSLWLYRLEHDEEAATDEELAIYNKVRQLFDKDLDEAYVSQLSSIVARLWGSMHDEVVVWGITRLMGESFRLHSQALVGFVDELEPSTGASTPSMTSQGADEDSVY